MLIRTLRTQALRLHIVRLQTRMRHQQKRLLVLGRKYRLGRLVHIHRLEVQKIPDMNLQPPSRPLSLRESVPRVPQQTVVLGHPLLVERIEAERVILGGCLRELARTFRGASFGLAALGGGADLVGVVLVVCLLGVDGVSVFAELCFYFLMSG